MEIKKIIVQVNKGIQNHIVSLCLTTISAKFKVPANNTTGNKTKLIETSYETICAAERNAPKNAYLELLAQPPIINK
jgi:hypothetical protein